MGLQINVSVPLLTVFIQGILSFFSPCVLPLLPIYIGYLSGGTAVRKKDGKMHYDRRKVLIHTLFFVAGISFAFFLLGLSVSAAARALVHRQQILVIAGGIVIFLFGIYQVFFYGKAQILTKEYRLPLKLNRMQMSPVTALVMGFFFSFAWTPCVGPTLAAVLMMVAGSETKVKGLLLVLVYTLGFVLPFLAVGIFTTSLLEVFKKHGDVVKYTVKIGGVLMILIGILMISGKMSTLSVYLSAFG